jgi:hypothetical protein
LHRPGRWRAVGIALTPPTAAITWPVPTAMPTASATIISLGSPRTLPPTFPWRPSHAHKDTKWHRYLLTETDVRVPALVSSLHKTRRMTTFFGRGERRECSRGRSRASSGLAAAPGDGLALVLSSWCRRSRPRLRLLDVRFSPWLSYRGVTGRSEEDGIWEALVLGAQAEEPQLLARSGSRDLCSRRG